MADKVEKIGPLNLLNPLYILSYSAWYLPITIFTLVVRFDFGTLLDFEKFKDVWFANFWAWFGPRARDNAAIKVMPLLQNNARGVCLDIGPGSGQWLYLFAKAMNPDISKIYGVEPNVGLHKALRENAVKAGLGDIYEIVGCGAEELASKGGIQTGTIDTIITVQCLCSIPTPKQIINDLVPYLKSGGQWIVYEHIRTKHQGDFVGLWQKAVNIVWPHFIGGCELDRPTDEWLLTAGDWEEVNLRPDPEDGRYLTIPHVMGTLKKR